MGHLSTVKIDLTTVKLYTSLGTTRFRRRLVPGFQFPLLAAGVKGGDILPYRDITMVEVFSQLILQERSADPADPPEGESVIWQSDGTGSGDDGDILVKVTAGGQTKTMTLIDYSAIV